MEFEIPFQNKKWENAILSGIVKVKGGFLATFSKKFFILTKDGNLYIFKSKKDHIPQNFNNPLKIKERKFNVKKTSIAIEDYPKFLTFKLKTIEELSNWIKKLEEAGGFLSNRLEFYEQQSIPRISKIEIKKWNINDVLDWLEIISIDISSGYFTLFKKKKINGKKLLMLTKEDLEEMENESESKVHSQTKEVIFSRIQDLKKLQSPFFNYGEITVSKKLKKICQKFSYNGEIKEWKFFIDAFSNPQELKKTFLLTKFISERSADEFNKYVPEEVKIEDFKPIANPFDSQTPGRYKIDSDIYRQPQYSGYPGIPIKLFLNEFEINYSNPRNLVSPIITRIPPLNLKENIKKVKYSLIIGPWLLEFEENTELIIPRLIYGEDCDDEKQLKDIIGDRSSFSYIKNLKLEEVAEKLAEIICKWNGIKKYGTEIHKNQGNTHILVEEILAAFETYLNFKPSCFQNFLNKLCREGSSEMIFDPSKEFRKFFSFEKPPLKIESHQQLYELVHGFNNPVAFQMDFNSESDVLQSFDRIFWMRHYQDEENKNYKIEGCDGDNVWCYFEDPRDHRSALSKAYTRSNLIDKKKEKNL